MTFFFLKTCILYFFFYWHHIPPMQWALLSIFSSGTVTVYLQNQQRLERTVHHFTNVREAVALAPPTISHGPTTAGWWITTCTSCDFSGKCHHSCWKSHLWHQLLICNRSMYSSTSVNINAKHVHSQSICVVNALFGSYMKNSKRLRCNTCSHATH